jgi:hypothetical protein
MPSNLILNGTSRYHQPWSSRGGPLRLHAITLYRRRGGRGDAQIDGTKLRAWLAESRRVQWDYKNIMKRKGRLERLP